MKGPGAGTRVHPLAQLRVRVYQPGPTAQTSGADRNRALPQKLPWRHRPARRPAARPAGRPARSTRACAHTHTHDMYATERYDQHQHPSPPAPPQARDQEMTQDSCSHSPTPLFLHCSHRTYSSVLGFASPDLHRMVGWACLCAFAWVRSPPNTHAQEARAGRGNADNSGEN